jgi:hypothetical protein
VGARTVGTKPQPARPVPVVAALPAVSGLPNLQAWFDLAFEIANSDAISLDLSEQQIHVIVAFLNTLTGNYRDVPVVMMKTP